MVHKMNVKSCGRKSCVVEDDFGLKCDAKDGLIFKKWQSAIKVEASEQWIAEEWSSIGGWNLPHLIVTCVGSYPCSSRRTRRGRLLVEYLADWYTIG
jgi:hypothetical protein